MSCKKLKAIQSKYDERDILSSGPKNRRSTSNLLINEAEKLGLACYMTSGKVKIVEIDESIYAKVKHSKGTFQSYPHMETITIKESDFLANGTDSDHEENFESDFEEVGVANCKLSLNPVKKKEKSSKIASEAPIASEATQSAPKKVLIKHKNPIACPECGKLMKNERVYSDTATEILEESEEYIELTNVIIACAYVFVEKKNIETYIEALEFVRNKNYNIFIEFRIVAYRRNQRLLVSLLPSVENLEQAFKIIIDKMPCTTVQMQWLNGNFSPKMWNHHKTGRRRTNNYSEGFHSDFHKSFFLIKKIFGCTEQ
ncbi:hypothetical protein BpHYR1_047652 [Brachionus plicatilis]|uniref:Uncharacterized protein n=1 Tax=Brachionus plicatilis TaxID=10195 RepID=A0A3M7RXU6_BRAPC|nr:hypothetical protein BpHYR1_047652 [Brachionus plicatilis]